MMESFSYLMLQKGAGSRKLWRRGAHAEELMVNLLIAQDQLRALKDLLGDAFPEGPPAAAVYDGDTHQVIDRAI